MRHAGRFIFALATGAWLTWACGSSDRDGTGGVGAAGQAGQGANVGAGGDTGAAAAPGEGGTTQQAAGSGQAQNGGEASSGAGAPGSQAGASGGPIVDCFGVGATCVQSSECCSGVCDPNTDQCASVVGTCAMAGGDCAAGPDCCSFNCGMDGKCDSQACTSDGEVCTSDNECCGGNCDGTCTPLNLACSTAGNACQDDGDCCSGDCSDGGVCTLGGSYCIQPGDVCARNNDCCTGDCQIADGKKLGVCSEPPAGPAFCTGVDGVLCNDCGDCCSRLCAPFGPTGAKICQPANGCHVTGDLCRRNEDCCGGALDETLPGYGNVICEIEPGKSVGLCRNPNNGPGDGGACNPQGNVCHYQNYSCDISSARANCCGGLGAKGGVCQLDPLGIPRCNGLGDDCREEGETCASTDDCCEDRPCVPDEQGVLRCGAGSCQRSGDACTIDADCCPGGVCVRAPGSTVGTCGGDPSGGEGGAPNGGGGAPGGGGTPGEGGAPTNPPGCSLYGQQCDGNSDCCNGVPCTNGLCRFPAG